MTRVTVRRALVGVGAVVALGYLAPIVYLRANERKLVFLPDRYGGRTVRPMPDSLHLPARKITIVSGDTARLAGLLIPAADSGAPWLLYLHGQAGSVTAHTLPQFYARWRALGVNVLAIDYRGFGESDNRPPSEAGVYADARAAYDWLRTTQHVPAGQIILYGHSLGSGVAIELATHVSAAGLIVEGALTSVGDMAALKYPWLPARTLVTQRFANIEKIGRVSMPKLIIHSTDDDIVPFAQGKALFEAAAAPKEFVQLTAGRHADGFLMDSARYWGPVQGFLQRLRDGGPRGESPPPGPVPPAAH